MKYILLVINLLFIQVVLFSQTKKEEERINLVRNGNFEDGNIDFSSDYIYNLHQVGEGQYSVTDNAAELNRDFRNPVGGDHTYRNGFYLVANADGNKGKKIWKADVQVVPNSLYDFSAFFCNLYTKLPVKSSFAFEDGDFQGNDPGLKFFVEGKQVGEVDRDFYHLFRWVYSTVTWYSGSSKGTVRLSIENENTTVQGNDIALDDISFTYVKTMPDDYVPPEMRTIMSEEYRAEMAKNYKPSRHVISFADLEKGDELAPGIFTIKYRAHNTKQDSVLTKKGEKFTLHRLTFNQGDAEISASSVAELDRLATWLLKEKAVRIRVEGHTDNRGKQELNLLLSEQRVLNVKIYLMEKGVGEERIETIGYGGALPIAGNDKEETRKLNRRVEFEILD